MEFSGIATITVKSAINTRFLKEAKELEKRWGKTQMEVWLRGYRRASCAVLLESQRLMNEKCDDPNDIKQFKRIKIPLCNTTLTT